MVTAKRYGAQMVVAVLLVLCSLQASAFWKKEKATHTAVAFDAARHSTPAGEFPVREMVGLADTTGLVRVVNVKNQVSVVVLLHKGDRHLKKDQIVLSPLAFLSLRGDGEKIKVRVEGIKMTPLEVSSTPVGPLLYRADAELEKTESGEAYFANDFTAAHPALPFGTMLRVINATDTTRFCKARVNHRFLHADYEIGLTPRIALHLGLTDTSQVLIRLWPGYPTPPKRVPLAVVADTVVKNALVSSPPAVDVNLSGEGVAADIVSKAAWTLGRVDTLHVFGDRGFADHLLYRPWGICVAGDGAFFVADRNNHAIKRFSVEGKLTRKIGGFGAGERGLKQPSAVCVDASSTRLYVADMMNNRIQVFSFAGNPVTRWGRYGREASGQFANPVAVALSPDSLLFVCDMTERIQFFSLGGVYQGMIRGFRAPSALAFDDDGYLWIADRAARQVVRCAPQTYSRQDSLQISFGSPVALAIGADRIYVGDEAQDKIWVFGRQGRPIGGFAEQARSLAAVGDTLIVLDSARSQVRILRVAVEEKRP